MTTSVAVFPPGFRVTDANDLPVSGAVIYFYAAGTTTPKTVYSDADLSVAIGTSVTCDSGGYPASGGNRVLVYVNENAYKIVGKDSSGNTLWEHDEVLGAIVPGSGSGSGGSSSTFGFKVGMVALTLTSSPEAGWVRLTDATQSLVKADYPDLNSWASAQGYPWGSSSTTFNIPPAGGYFLRFGSSGSSIDPSGPRSPGSTQDDAFQGHKFNITNTSSPFGTVNGGSPGVGTSGTLGNSGSATPAIGAVITDGTNGTPRTATETRGKNVAMYADMLAVPALVASGLVGAVGPAYKWNSSTAAADVSSGRLALNNATIDSATTFYVSETSDNGSALATFLQSIPSGSKVFITKVGTPATFISFTLSSTATDAGTYDSFTITSVSHGGTLSNGDTVSVVFMPAGTTGSNGSNGSNGTDPGIRWLFASSTTMADPSAGNIRLNNATLSSATAAAIHYSCGETGNPSVSDWVKSFDDSSSTAHRGHLVIKKASAPQNFVIFDVTGALTDNTTWAQLALTYLGPTTPPTFSAADVLSVQFYRTGNAGTGIGDLLAANNLSDVSAKYTAFDNLNVRGSDIASASTVNLETATGNLVDVTGTTAITAITLNDGHERTVRFTGILTLTNGANLVLPGGSNITTAAGDFAVFRGYASSVVRCISYTKADGTAVVGGSGASAGTGLVSSGGSLYVQQLTPGGRLTLTSGTPVLTTDAAAQTTIYYAPFVHGFIPVYNGTDMRLYSILGSTTDAVGLSLAMAGSANWASGSVYDLFYAYVSGVLYFGTGPAWSSTTSRGTGAGTTEVERYNGIWTNKNSMTLRNAAGTQTVPAHQATLLGSFYATANGTTTVEFGGIGSGGAAAKMYLANQYNKQQWVGFIGDSTDSWTYNSTTVRAANGSSTMRANYIACMNDFFVEGLYTIQCETNGSNGITTGMDQDSTTTFGDCGNFHPANSIRSVDVSAASWPAGLGVHYISANEACANSVAAVTVYGDNGTPASRQGGMTAKGCF